MAEFDSAIPPGGTGKLIVKVRTKGIQGKRTKTVRVRSDDPKQPNISLRVSFHSQSPVEVLPQPMAHLSGLTGETITKTLVLRRSDGEALEIMDAAATRQGITVELEQVTAETADSIEQPAASQEGRSPRQRRDAAKPGDWRVHLTLDDSTAQRTEAGLLKVTTNHPQRPQLQVPLRVRVRPLLSFQPNRVQLRARAGGEPAVRTVTLRHGRREQYDISGLSVSGKLPSVAVSRVHERTASVQQVQVKVDPSGLEPGVYRGKLTAKTSLPDFPEISVPIRITVTPPVAPRAAAP